jgi:hypothetical protein
VIRRPDGEDELEGDVPASDSDALGHEAAASIDDTYVAACPYCGEEVEITIDLGGGEHQSYVEDCGVCCRPWQVNVEVDDDGAAHLELEPLDE